MVDYVNLLISSVLFFYNSKFTNKMHFDRFNYASKFATNYRLFLQF